MTLPTIDQVVKRADTIKGFMYVQELRWLAERARELQAPAAWCEIGCWQGRSATAVAGGLRPGTRLVLLDNFSGPTTREMPDPEACKRTIKAAIASLRKWKPGIDVSLGIGDSVAQADNYLDATFDVVFIDGDHKYQKVVADITAWRPKLKPGGLLCGHDFHHPAWCGVEQAVSELVPDYAIVPDTSIWYARV